MKFRMFLCAAIMAGYGLTAAPALAAPQIGYVDLQRAILQVDEGKRAQEKLKKTLEKKQKDLEAKLAPRKKSLEALQKKVAEGKGSASDRAEFAKARAELQEVAMKEQAELQKLERETLGKIVVKMRKVIDGIGRKGGYTVILEASQNRLLFAQDQLDLTNEVIRKYNITHK